MDEEKQTECDHQWEECEEEDDDTPAHDICISCGETRY